MGYEQCQQDRSRLLTDNALCHQHLAPASGESTDAAGRRYSVLKMLYRCKKSLKPSLRRPVAPTCSVGSTCEKNENSV